MNLAVWFQSNSKGPLEIEKIDQKDTQKWMDWNEICLAFKQIITDKNLII